MFIHQYQTTLLGSTNQRMNENKHQQSGSATDNPKTYHTRHRWEGIDSLHGVIIDAVAATTNKKIDEIAAEYEADHSKNIEQLFSTEEGGRKSYGLVRFIIDNALVTIHSDGWLVAEQRDVRSQ